MGMHLGRGALSAAALAAALALGAGCDEGSSSDHEQGAFDGKQVFRHDTFGSEARWTDDLRMHEVIEGAVDPATALAVGLKVDSDALPPGYLATADLGDPATTVDLIRRGAVVGIEGKVAPDGTLRSVGITCALCHSTVDDTVMPGIGRRVDGPANRDLDPGRILALSPAMQDPAVQQVLLSWGPGRYDAYFNQDGVNDPVVIPSVWGLEGVDLETYGGDGPIGFWNSYVAVTQMGGQGSFEDARLGIDVEAEPDLVTPKLPALLAYQLSLEPPAPPPGSFDAAAAARGEVLFQGKANCASCHEGPRLTDANRRLHPPGVTGTDAVRALRGFSGKVRTTPLRALRDRAGYFHDGSAPTLEAVVDHYDAFFGLGLTPAEKADLAQYLRSL